MCFDSNGTAPRNQAEFDRNFNSDASIAPGMAGVGRAIANAQGAPTSASQSAPYQSIYNKPLDPVQTPAPQTSGPYQSAYNTPQTPAPQAPTQGLPYPSAYKAPASVGDVMRRSAPTAGARTPGSGRVVS
jgi:hypothetical protein